MKTKLWLPILAGLWFSTIEALACEACGARAMLVCSPISLAFKPVIAVLIASGRLKPGRTLAVFAGYMALGYLGWMLTNNNLHVPVPLPKAVYQFFWQFGVLDMLVLAGLGQIASFRLDPARGLGVLRVLIGLLASFGLRFGFSWIN